MNWTFLQATTSARRKPPACGVSLDGVSKPPSSRPRRTSNDRSTQTRLGIYLPAIGNAAGGSLLLAKLRSGAARTLRRLLTTTASIETGAFAGSEERLESIHADPTNHLSLKQAGSLDLEGARSASAIAHHRSRRLPSTHPTSAIMPIAMLYQVATKSGLSSVQCMA